MVVVVVGVIIILLFSSSSLLLLFCKSLSAEKRRPSVGQNRTRIEGVRMSYAFLIETFGPYFFGDVARDSAQEFIIRLSDSSGQQQQQ